MSVSVPATSGFVFLGHELGFSRRPLPCASALDGSSFDL